jgi:predicted permease
MHADKGFTAERILAVDVPLSPYEYKDGNARNAVYDAAMREVAALPGVVGVAMTSYLPLEGEAWGESIYRLAPNGTRAMDLTANFRFVTPNYFSLLGVPILRGRAFTNADRGASRMVISENTARALWPNESALGKRAPLGGTDSVYEVIGIAANVRTSGIEHDASPTVYRPYWEFGRAENIVIRTAVDPAAITPQVRRIVRSLAPTAPIAKVRTMDEIISQVVAQRRFELVLIELFAATALITACLGIYGIISYSLGGRAGEISIRLALGAQPRNVHALVAREILVPLAVGLAAGLGAAVLSGRAIAGMLYEVQPTDAVTLVGVAGILLLVAAFACWLPARRAARIDPVEALRAS